MKYINLRKKKIESEKKERKKNVTLHIKHKHTNHTTQTHKKNSIEFYLPLSLSIVDVSIYISN